MFSKRLLRLALVGMTALGICLASPSAFAGEKEAKEYYSQAKDAYQAGDFSKAADLLERAYAEDPNLIYQYNRILALQGMEKYNEALRVMDIYENPMKKDGRFDDVAEIRAQIEAALAKKSESDDTTADDPAPDEQDSDEQQEEKQALEEPGATEPPPPNTASRDRIIGWSFVGAGIVAAAAGSPFYTRNPDDLSADKVSSYRTISIITLSSAVVLSGVGAYFLYRGYSSDTVPSQSAGRANDVLLTPYVAGDGGGGALILRF